MKNEKIWIEDCLHRYFWAGKELGLSQDDLVADRNLVYSNGDHSLKYKSIENQNRRHLQVTIPLDVVHHKTDNLIMPAHTFNFVVPKGRRCYFELLFSSAREIEILFEEGDDGYRVDGVEGLGAVKRKRSVYTAIEELVKQFAKDCKKGTSLAVVEKGFDSASLHGVSALYKQKGGYRL